MNTFKVGDWVEVRSKMEIFATLDEKGRLDSMPFMPEMLQFCGQRLRVHKSAHKTCDTVFPIRGRRVDSAVHLDTRCSGEAHGGCQAGCLIFWKEAWLKPVDGAAAATPVRIEHAASSEPDPIDSALQGCTTVPGEVDANGPRYVCQATQLPYATKDLAWWDLRQYVEDYRSGNVGVWRLFQGWCYSTYDNLNLLGIGLGRPLRWIYDKLHPLWGGTLYPRKAGSIPVGQKTPVVSLDLQPGELVRVKRHEDILATLDQRSMNRGLYWDAEMVPYCGGTYRVLKRVTRIVDEKTGRMLQMKTPCIILDNVYCQARYSACRMFCPRGIYSYWREIWLERVAPGAADAL